MHVGRCFREARTSASAVAVCLSTTGLISFDPSLISRRMRAQQSATTMNPARKPKCHTSADQLAFAFADAPAQRLSGAVVPPYEPPRTKPAIAPPLTPVAPLVIRKRPPRPTKPVRSNPEISHEDRRLTVDEAAALLSVSVKTLEAWRRLGKGPLFVKLGRSVRYTVRSLDEFTRDRTVRNSAEGRMLDLRR